MKTILVVEDERDLAELVSFNLQKEGFRVLTVHDGVAALEAARNAPPDLMLLDLMLPGVSGTEICRLLKADARTAAIPVIMMTARGEEIDRVVGFEVGADDYVVKPFSMRELLLRVKAVLRRNIELPRERVLRVGAVAIDTERHHVLVEEREVVLTTIEYKLLLYLAHRLGKLQSRE
ncbi:MAG TPA: response regulator, partial [Verrucomicrobiae bacterium]|nr:response regulator [Verrucomicrobiae bacterium]